MQGPQVPSTVEERLALISRGLTGLDGMTEIQNILNEGRTAKGLWATAPTGKPHIAYLVPLLKLADFVKAGLDVIVLFCDLYAFLVNYKDPMEIVAHRTAYYKFMIRAILRILGVPDDKVHFVEGSSYELSKDFMLDSYKLSALTDEQEVRETGSEYRHATKLSVLLCPGLPALAEEYLDSDFQFGGEDQSGLFAFNERFLPQLGYRKRGHLMNPMVDGLTGTKMSSSVPDSKIELLDSPETIHRKILQASCQDGHKNGNGVLGVLKFIIIPLRENQLQSSEGRIVVFRADLDEGKPKEYYSYDEIASDFMQKKLSSLALKQAVAASLCEVLAPLREMHEKNKEWQLVEDMAYPDS